MEFIIGGCFKNPDLIIDDAIEYFERRFSQSFDFHGMKNQEYFMGIVRNNANKVNKNIFFFENCKIFKSLYYHTIPDILKDELKNSDFKNFIKNLHNDFIFAI